MSATKKLILRGFARIKLMGHRVSQDLGYQYVFGRQACNDERSNVPPWTGMTTSFEKRANTLVNPNSGIANDYLNRFNAFLLLIENLPALLPEMIVEVLSWKPIGYVEYFQNSALPGKNEALKIYDSIDPQLRQDFESMVALLDTIILRSIAIVSENCRKDGTIDPDEIGEVCEELAADLRAVLDRTADLVNFGFAPPLERPQEMADRILGQMEQLAE